MSGSDHPCLLCASKRLEVASGSAILRGVTSDCRPWPHAGMVSVCPDCGHVQKVLDEKWQRDTAAIYASYQLYFQGAGEEQKIFVGGEGASRSSRVWDGYDQSVGLPRRGRLLDVGCGTGVALTTFGARRPDWDLYGFERSERNREMVESIPGVARMYEGALEAIEETFDLITLFHVFEHVTNPVALLQSLHRLLNPGGVILIQVPNRDANPFDLLTLDHCSHYTCATLAGTIERAGLPGSVVGSEWLPKEVTAIIPAGAVSSLPPLVAGAPPLLPDLDSSLAWLQKVVADAGQRASRGSLGIFGVAIAGVWLANSLGEMVDFFVDEDPCRSGSTVMGRPVLTPATAPCEGLIYLPFPPHVAEEIQRRLRRDYPKLVTFLPPEPHSL